MAKDGILPVAEIGILYLTIYKGLITMTFYYCDACHYCLEYTSLPDRCPDCGKTQWDRNPAVRPATEKAVDALLRARAEDDK